MTEPLISVHLDAVIDMTVEEIWPDGDQPELITAEAIRAVMEKCGHKERILAEWDLLRDVDVTITVDRPNPAYGGETVLFGEPPKPTLHEIARAWDSFARSQIA